MTSVDAMKKDYEFNSANKIYVSNTTDVRQCVEADFPHELEKFPFKTDPEGCRLVIIS